MIKFLKNALYITIICNTACYAADYCDRIQTKGDFSDNIAHPSIVLRMENNNFGHISYKNNSSQIDWQCNHNHYYAKWRSSSTFSGHIDATLSYSLDGSLYLTDISGDINKFPLPYEFKKLHTRGHNGH